jgi:hypothetical protein
MKNFAVAVLGLLVCIAMSGVALAAEEAKTEVPSKSVTGTLVDSYCYSVMGAHGASHKQCAMGCAKKGIPVSLEEKGTSKMYVLLPKKNAQPLPKEVISKMEEEVTVTGKEYDKGGNSYLTVESVK